MPDSNEPPSLEWWTPLRTHLVNIEDLLQRSMYVAAHADASTAPSAPRPIYPHMKRRKEIRKQKDVAMLSVLVPHEFGDD